VQVFIECTPLYQGIEILRALTTGVGVGVGVLGHALYFVVMALVGIVASAHRLEKLLLT
jgi:lipooligosaccharide transport system permease protein